MAITQENAVILDPISPPPLVPLPSSITRLHFSITGEGGVGEIENMAIVGEDLGWSPKGPKSAHFLAKRLGLKMTGFSKCRESFQTPWNASYVLANGFPTTFGIIGEDSGRILKGPKSADFEKKACGL